MDKNMNSPDNNRYTKDRPYGVNNKDELIMKPNQEVYTDYEPKKGEGIGKNNILKVKIKKLSEDSVLPKYAKSGDAGLDFTSTSKQIDGDIITYGTSIALEIPDGYVGLLFPRSSVYKQDLVLSNAVGVADSSYRGEIMFKYRKTKFNDGAEYEIGERIGQLIIIPIPQIEWIESNELSKSERGNQGYGSTGV